MSGLSPKILIVDEINWQEDSVNKLIAAIASRLGMDSNVRVVEADSLTITTPAPALHRKKSKHSAAVVYRGKTYVKGFVEPGRNRPCPCNSGKKFKNCCMTRMEAPIREALVDAHRADAAKG